MRSAAFTRKDQALTIEEQNDNLAIVRKLFSTEAFQDLKARRKIKRECSERTRKQIGENASTLSMHANYISLDSLDFSEEKRIGYLCKYLASQQLCLNKAIGEQKDEVAAAMRKRVHSLFDNILIRCAYIREQKVIASAQQAGLVDQACKEEIEREAEKALAPKRSHAIHLLKAEGMHADILDMKIPQDIGCDDITVIGLAKKVSSGEIQDQSEAGKSIREKLFPEIAHRLAKFGFEGIDFSSLGLKDAFSLILQAVQIAGQANPEQPSLPTPPVINPPVVDSASVSVDSIASKLSAILPAGQKASSAENPPASVTSTALTFSLSSIEETNNSIKQTSTRLEGEGKSAFGQANDHYKEIFEQAKVGYAKAFKQTQFGKNFSEIQSEEVIKGLKVEEKEEAAGLAKAIQVQNEEIEAYLNSFSKR